MTTYQERLDFLAQMKTPELAAEIQRLKGLWKGSEVAILPDQTLVEVLDGRLKNREIELFADGIEGSNPQARDAFVERGRTADEKYQALLEQHTKAKESLAHSKVLIKTTWEDYRALMARSAQVTAIINFAGGPA